MEGGRRRERARTRKGIGGTILETRDEYKTYDIGKTPRIMKLITDPNQGPNRPRVMTKESAVGQGQSGTRLSNP